jgi:hypothetical protein
MSIRVQGLRGWLECRYEDFSVDVEPLHGTYGLIWFMTARSANTHPNTFAVKTVDPEPVAQASGRDRLDGTVVPIKSDMFSMGVVASQLLQGQHPAGNLGRLQSGGKWRRWIENGKRDLQEIESPRLKAMIERCLAPSSNSRPDALEFLHEICAELKARYRLDIAGTLVLWRRLLSREARSLSFSDAKERRFKRLNRIRVIDFETCESWASLAESVVYLSAADDAERDRIRKLASDYLITILGPLGKAKNSVIGATGRLCVNTSATHCSSANWRASHN